jgi:hypothetical protein
MSDGATHFRYYQKAIPPLVWIVTFFLVIALWAQSYFWWGVVGHWNLIMMQYVLIIRYVDPDLDQIGITSADGRMIREIPVFGYLFSGWWTIYAYAMNVLCAITGTSKGKLGAHRSLFTHTLFPGTIIRVIWFNIPVFAILMYIKIDLSVYGMDILSYISTQTIAMMLGDVIHYRLDGL